MLVFNEKPIRTLFVSGQKCNLEYIRKDIIAKKAKENQKQSEGRPQKDEKPFLISENLKKAIVK